MRGRLAPIAVLLAFSLFAASALVAERLQVGLAEGELPFRLRAFSFPAAEDSSRLLMLATLRADLLHWESDDSLRAALEVDWALHASGEIRGVLSESLRFSKARDLNPIEGQVLIAAEWTLPPGFYRLEFNAKDPGRKLGRVFGLFGRAAVGHWSGRIEARDYPEGGLSDILLYTVGVDSLSRPNPWSSFIEGDPYLEIYSVLRTSTQDEDRFNLTLDLNDSKGEQILRKRGSWTVAGQFYPLRLRLPLAGLEAGDYSLSLSSGDPGPSAQIQFADFQILPRPRRSNEQRLFEQVQADLLLDEEAYRDWKSLPTAQRAELLRRNWEGRDPDPRMPGNLLRDKFLRRYQQARRRFGGFQPGPLTDRGRMWILLGEPDEIQVDVLPENKASLYEALSDLHGISEGGEINPALQRDLGHVGLGGAGSPGVESEAFEMWTYRLGGDPLLGELRLGLREVGLKLIFLDRSGTGEYTLEFSSEKFDF